MIIHMFLTFQTFFILCDRLLYCYAIIPYNVDALQMCPIECTVRDIIGQHSSSLTAWRRRSNNFFMHIVNAHKEGKGYRAISKQFQVQESTTQNIIREEQDAQLTKKH